MDRIPYEKAERGRAELCSDHVGALRVGEIQFSTWPKSGTNGLSGVAAPRGENINPATHQEEQHSAWCLIFFLVPRYSRPPPPFYFSFFYLGATHGHKVATLLRF
ncbi:hypothetical protein GOP47_0015891 [Adiantum capillus-veneris]|uniref:Uncharacterized protein n=1 Tax=Adiantum capillus-veneris TaxID=13818 RepID=A0A9D4UKM4_ADICA|nr:hypothetical protein GOP47_0015891 [Adiantum capillus-veneris]